MALAKIRGPSGHEKEVGEYVYQWMEKNGLNPFRQTVVGNRFNVIGVIPGTGGGKNLAFNSHLDTAPLFIGEPRAVIENESVYSSWRDGDRLYGLGVMNCQGPMAVWLTMGKALKESAIKLRGDVVLSAVVGEIGLAPVDEYQGPQYMETASFFAAGTPKLSLDLLWQQERWDHGCCGNTVLGIPWPELYPSP